MKKTTSQVSNAAPELRKQRVFSEELKRKIVKEIAAKLHTVTEIQRLYQVSPTSVYRWVYQYTPGLAPGIKQVVQMESEAERTRQLVQRVAELERIVGQKQMAIDLLEKVLEFSSKAHGYDQKKSFLEARSSGSGATEDHTPTR